MKISFRIISADSDVSRIEKYLQGIPAEKSKYEIASYWKIPGCSEITCEYSGLFMEARDLQEVVRKIGGSDELNASQQGEYEEYSVYTTTEKITRGNGCAFVVCFVNKKEDTK